MQCSRLTLSSFKRTLLWACWQIGQSKEYIFTSLYTSVHLFKGYLWQATESILSKTSEGSMWDFLFFFCQTQLSAQVEVYRLYWHCTHETWSISTLKEFGWRLSWWTSKTVIVPSHLSVPHLHQLHIRTTLFMKEIHKTAFQSRHAQR